MAQSLSCQATVDHREIGARLHAVGIQPTQQRLAIAQVLLQAPVHLSADDILLAARRYLPRLSRATVYNTLPLFVEKGLLRALRLDAERTVYDSRTDAHFHLYHEDTGVLQDMLSEALHWPSMPPIAKHLEMEGIDLIERVRQRAAEPGLQQQASA